MNLANRIKQHLTDDLLKPGHTGHCYVASEVYYHLSSEHLKPKCIRHEGDVHWFLERIDGKIIDITADQFSTPVPYHLGRGKGFLTKEPSKRARLIINRMQL